MTLALKAHFYQNITHIKHRFHRAGLPLTATDMRCAKMTSLWESLKPPISLVLIYKISERITCNMYGFFLYVSQRLYPCGSRKVSRVRGGVRDAASDQELSRLFYHCKKQYLGKSMGGLDPLHPPLGPPMLYKHM